MEQYASIISLIPATSFDVPEYPPGEGPPTEPYKPRLPANNAKLKSKKYASKIRKKQPPFIKTPTTDDDCPSPAEEGNKTSSENIEISKDNEKKIPESSSRRNSQIDLTLQYYEADRPINQTMQNSQRSLKEETAPNITRSSPLPQLSSRPTSWITNISNKSSARIDQRVSGRQLQFTPGNILCNMPLHRLCCDEKIDLKIYLIILN